MSMPLGSQKSASAMMALGQTAKQWQCHHSNSGGFGSAKEAVIEPAIASCLKSKKSTKHEVMATASASEAVMVTAE